MNLVVVTGLSGSGKTVALHMLEDHDYYCIDNLPVGLLEPLGQQMQGPLGEEHADFAIGIDARSSAGELRELPARIQRLRDRGIRVRTVFLRAEEPAILRRFSETRRRHPLSAPGVSLADAVRHERELLDPVAAASDIFLDTTHTNVHELRELIRQRVIASGPAALTLSFLSFGYKHGVPGDADFVFDLRCLPNPHWEPRLRPLTGRDAEVAAFLEQSPETARMLAEIEGFVDRWLPCFERENRSYLTIALGCTGGQHRSVYATETLGGRYRARAGGEGAPARSVVVRHRELG